MTLTHEQMAFPADRRFRLWIRPSMLLLFALVALGPLVVAWIQYLIAGLPPLSGDLDPAEEGPHGFPFFVRWGHYFNILFMLLIIRSGLSILFDHPRLYWNVHCTPGSEWIRFTPLKVPTDRVWTANDDGRYLTPWIGLPGGKHGIGMARHWHFLTALFWLANGLLFVILLFASGQWQRIVPTSWQIFPEAWSVFVHYATFHMPPEPDGYYRYNSLQHLSYGAVVFLMAPLSVLTGLAMSPAIDNHFPWYPRLFGNRQVARSIHFLLLLGYLGFFTVHVLMVYLSGLTQNLNHIVLGTDETRETALNLAAVGIGFILFACYASHWLSWHRPRLVQGAARILVRRVMALFLDPLAPRAQHTREEISPHFWPNGKMPTSEEWTKLADEDFRDYRLRVYGLVGNPVELSLEEIKALGKQEQITQHHCIQGWSGIAEWGGLPLAKLVELVRPKPEAQWVVFHSFGEGLYGGEYYDCHSIEDLLHPQSILAFEMNYQPLNHVHGAPLRLRVENQLGYKMVKWIRSIEFVASVKEVGKGFGGRKEDDDYFDVIANI
jgi:DMSO/TMAO reductase YedYZ molybdopterin-dependent catalytic subunit/thiosulfate reductase cytochrome b subunit